MMQAFAGLAPQLNSLQGQASQGMADLVPACEHALAPALRNGDLPQEARAAIEQVLRLLRGAFGEAAQNGESETVAAQVLTEQIDRMYQGFQYQDRISQMMALLEADMNRLKDAIGNPSASTPPLDAWLTRLESQYAMEEQRRSHGAVNGNGPDDGKETIFF
jgi:methyl-accepting chemotaxis protein